MASLNKVIIIGNLTRDPELKYTSNGTAYAKFGMAINEKFKEKESTVFVDCVTWAKTAELASEYLSKGSQCAIDGRLSFSSWESKTGEKRSKLEVTADRVVFLGKKDNGKSSSRQDEGGYEDDVPF